MLNNYTVLDLNHIHCIFIQFIKHHPRPLCTNDFLDLFIDGEDHRWLLRSIQRLIKSWVNLDILENLGTSSRSSSRYYRLSKYGEAFIKIFRRKNNVSFFDNQKFFSSSKDISFRYFFTLYFSVQNNPLEFTSIKIKDFGDSFGYKISKRSWDRNLNIFEKFGIFSSNKSIFCNAKTFKIEKNTISIFNDHGSNYHKIQFEKDLISLGIISNYEKYIDYNLLIFHILFRKWVHSPMSFELYIEQHFIR